MASKFIHSREQLEKFLKEGKEQLDEAVKNFMEKPDRSNNLVLIQSCTNLLDLAQRFEEGRFKGGQADK